MTAIVGWAPIVTPWSDRTLDALEPLIPASQFAASSRALALRQEILARLVPARFNPAAGRSTVMLDTTYYGLTASDWRSFAVVAFVFAATAVVSVVRHRQAPARGAVRPR